MPFFTERQISELYSNSQSIRQWEDQIPVSCLMYELNFTRYIGLLTQLFLDRPNIAYGIFEDEAKVPIMKEVNLLDLYNKNKKNIVFDCNFSGQHKSSVYLRAGNIDREGISKNGWTDMELINMRICNEHELVNSNILKVSPHLIQPTKWLQFSPL